MNCGCSYTGETGRSLQKCLAEHKSAIRRGNRNNGVAVHAWHLDHRVNWESAEVLEQESNYWKRRVLEAIHIKLSGQSVNLDCDLSRDLK